MSIIRIEQERVKASDETDIDAPPLKVYQECMGQTFQDVARKLGMNWHTVEGLLLQKSP